MKAMDHKQFEQRVLDQDLTAQDIQRDPACVEAAANDPANRAALEQIDAIRQALGHRDQDDNTPAPTGGWSAFEQRLAAVASSDCDTPRHRPIVAWLGWAAAAAAIVVAALVWSSRFDHAVLPTQPSATVHTQVQMLPTPSELDERLRMFREVNSAFDHRTHWVAMANDHADLGLGQAINAPGRLIVIRLTLQRPYATEPASQVDLIILAGQQAVVTVPLDNGLATTYRVDTQPAGGDQRAKVGVWAEIHPHGERQVVRAALAARVVYEAGHVQTVGQMVDKGQRYVLGVGFGEANREQDVPQSSRSTNGGAL